MSRSDASSTSAGYGSAWPGPGALAIAAVLLASPGWAAEKAPQAPPSTVDGHGSHEPQLGQPPRPQMDRTARTIRVPAAPAPALGQGASGDAGALKGMRVESLSVGQGRVVVGGVARDIRPGDALQGYTVRAIDGGRVILTGTHPAAGDTTAVITFDARGVARVRVYSSQDTTATVPPEVR